MKVYDYIIVFKQRGYRVVDGISQLMLLLAVIVFGSSISGIITAQYKVKGSWELLVFMSVIIAAIIGWWIYCNLRQKKGEIPFFRLALFLAALGWYAQPKGLFISIIYLLAAILEKQVKFPQEVAFDEEGLVVNSFPKKYFYWNDIANVILKDGILTIDFHNNKLIQKEIETPATMTLEQEFNEFCKNRLNAYR